RRRHAAGQDTDQRGTAGPDRAAVALRRSVARHRPGLARRRRAAAGAALGGRRVMRKVRGAILVLLPTALAAWAGAALAQDDGVDERAGQLQRDQQLIQLLVDSGVRLAAEDDPLRRADYCNRLADRLGKE